MSRPLLLPPAARLEVKRGRNPREFPPFGVVRCTGATVPTRTLAPSMGVARSRASPTILVFVFTIYVHIVLFWGQQWFYIRIEARDTKLWIPNTCLLSCFEVPSVLFWAWTRATNVRCSVATSRHTGAQYRAPAICGLAVPSTDRLAEQLHLSQRATLRWRCNAQDVQMQCGYRYLHAANTDGSGCIGWMGGPGGRPRLC